MQSQVSKAIIESAARIIKKGGVVVFPTETVYGLGADVFNESAVRKIFKIKGRPEGNPLTIHISKLSDVRRVARKVPAKALVLMKKYWPGPLTIVLSKKKNVPDAVTAGLKTVGIRMPDHPDALALIRKSGTLIAAPSANISGKKSPVSLSEVSKKILKKADYAINGGKCKLGVPSTIIDFTVNPPKILRKGPLSP